MGIKLSLDLVWARKYLLARRKVTPQGCWEFTGGKSHGYGCFRKCGEQYSTHVVAAYIWKIKRRSKKAKCVCHTCDNRRCFRPSHLYFGTFADNTKDMMKRGRGKGQFTEEATRGEKHWKARLNRTDILNIRQAIKTGRWGILTFLAKKYKVTIQQISRIKHGRAWWWLQCA